MYTDIIVKQQQMQKQVPHSVQQQNDTAQPIMYLHHSCTRCTMNFKSCSTILMTIFR